MTSAKLKAGLLVGIVAVVILAGTGLAAHQPVDEGSVGVETDRGAATGTAYEPGWHFINPFTQGVHDIDTRPRTVTYNGDNSVYIVTKDGQDVWADVTVRYRVHSDDAVTFFKEYKNHKRGVARVIEPTVRSDVRDEGSTYSARNIINKTSREGLEVTLMESLNEETNGTGMSIEAVHVRDVTLNDEYSDQLEDVEIENENARQKEIAAQGDAEAERIRAQGDSDAAAIRDRNLTQEVLMDKYLDSVNNADTVIITTNDEGTPVILNRNGTAAAGGGGG